MLGGIAVADVRTTWKLVKGLCCQPSCTDRAEQGGETDWKILAIDTNDTLAGLVNCMSLIQSLLIYASCEADNLTTKAIEDLEKYRPNLAKTFYDWFTVSHLSTTHRTASRTCF